MFANEKIKLMEQHIARLDYELGEGRDGLTNNEQQEASLERGCLLAEIEDFKYDVDRKLDHDQHWYCDYGA